MGKISSKSRCRPDARKDDAAVELPLDSYRSAAVSDSDKKQIVLFQERRNIISQGRVCSYSRIQGDIGEIWSTFQDKTTYSYLSNRSREALLFTSVNTLPPNLRMTRAKENKFWREAAAEKRDSFSDEIRSSSFKRMNLFFKKNKEKESPTICSFHCNNNFSFEKIQNKFDNNGSNEFSRGKSSMSLRLNSARGHSSDSKSMYLSDDLPVDSENSIDIDNRKDISRSSVTKSKSNCRLNGAAEETEPDTTRDRGDSDKDTLKGYSDKDTLKRYSDKDTLKGYSDKDTLKGYSDQDTLKGYSEFVDARWEAFGSPAENRQVLTPCPTCGRKFSEEAAFRHFPICFKVKEKRRTSKKTIKSVSIPNSCTASFIEGAGAEPVHPNRKRDEALSNKPSKAILFTFTRANRTSGTAKAPTNRATVLSDRTNVKPPVNNSDNDERFQRFICNDRSRSKSDSNESNRKKRKVPVSKSEGIRKSAFAWKKSVKEPDTISKPTADDIKQSDSSESDKSRLDRNAERSAAVRKPSGRRPFGSDRNRTELRAETEVRRPVDKYKRISRKLTGADYKELRLYEEDMQDLDVIPQSLRVRDSAAEKPKCDVEDYPRESEACLLCDSRVPTASLDVHTSLCRRITDIESRLGRNSVLGNDSFRSRSKKDAAGTVSQNVKTIRASRSSDYHLRKRGDSLPAASRTVASLECPCCSALVDVTRDC